MSSLFVFLAVKRKKKSPSWGNSFCTIPRDFMVVNFPLEFEVLTWTIFFMFLRAS